MKTPNTVDQWNEALSSDGLTVSDAERDPELWAAAVEMTSGTGRSVLGMVLKETNDQDEAYHLVVSPEVGDGPKLSDLVAVTIDLVMAERDMRISDSEWIELDRGMYVSFLVDTSASGSRLT